MSKTGAPNEPARPWGRRLEDLWLKKDGIPDPSTSPRYPKTSHLYQAEWELLECAARGEPCEIGSERPTAATLENTIRANLLRFIALGGDETNPLHEHGVQLEHAHIDGEGGELDFRGAKLPENLALAGCVIDAAVILQDTIAETINLQGCSVDRLRADRLETSGGFYLSEGFEAREEVSLRGAKIGGDVAFGNANLESLTAVRMRAEGTVFLNNEMIASGKIDLTSAQIGGDLACSNAHFRCSEIALVANRANIGGAALLDNGFTAEGKVSLEDAKIGTGVRCSTGKFLAPDQSLSLKNAAVSGNVDFGVVDEVPCTFNGSVSLQRISINGDLIFTGTKFNGSGRVNLRNAKVDGQLFWRQIVAEEKTVKADKTEKIEEAAAKDKTGPKPPLTELDLSGASCLTLSIEWESWCLPKQILLDHFTYQGFSGLDADWNTKRWIQWLERQPKSHLTSRFRPHPYQQLAKVLDSAGFEEEARAIRIERREKQRIFARDHEPKTEGAWPAIIRRLGNFWLWAQKIFIGHGYRPGVAVIWLLGLVAVGGVIYEAAARVGIMTPTHPLIFKEAVWEGDPFAAPTGKIPLACRRNWVYPENEISGSCAASVASEYSSFNAIVYSLDTAIPVVNFRMEEDWAPRVVDWQTGLHDWAGWLVRLWEWVQIGAGWALSLLFVSAIGGVIRRE